MTWINELKEKIKGYDSKNPDNVAADKIRNDPKYQPILDKLRLLNDNRVILKNQLEKVELDIEACLIVLAHAERKEEINKENNKVKSNPSSRIN